MRLAIIADVHGNYPALQAVVRDAVANHADMFLFVGDYVFDLPYANDVARFLMELPNAYIIKGNKESYLLSMAEQDQDTWVYDQMGAAYQTYRELTPEAFAFFTGLPEDCRIRLSSGAELYAHHCTDYLLPYLKSECSSSLFREKMQSRPFTHEQFLSEFTRQINGGTFAEQIGRQDADIFVFGHNHLQAYGYCGDMLLINPGSCGQPLDFDNRAPYTILEETDGGLRVIEKRVPYDIEAVIAYTKNSAFYNKGRIWCEMVFSSLRTGRDYYYALFEIAHQITVAKGENEPFFTNETWAEAYAIFCEKYGVHSPI